MGPGCPGPGQGLDWLSLAIFEFRLPGCVSSQIINKFLLNKMNTRQRRGQSTVPFARIPFYSAWMDFCLGSAGINNEAISSSKRRVTKALDEHVAV